MQGFGFPTKLGSKFGNRRPIGYVELPLCCLEGSLLLPPYFLVERGSVLTNLKVVDLIIRTTLGILWQMLGVYLVYPFQTPSNGYRTLFFLGEGPFSMLSFVLFKEICL